MIIRADGPAEVEEFCQRILEGLPLADAVLSLWAFVMEPGFLESLYQRHRGRSFSSTLTFPVMVKLMSDALLQHAGSGRQAFTRARERDELPTCIEAVYGKLRRVPLELSRGFFEETTERLRTIRPEGMSGHVLPASLDAFTVVVVDGKILKKVAVADLAWKSGQAVRRQIARGLRSRRGLGPLVRGRPRRRDQRCQADPGTDSQRS